MKYDDVPSSQDPPAKDHPLIMELHELKTKIFMDIATWPTWLFSLTTAISDYGSGHRMKKRYRKRMNKMNRMNRNTNGIVIVTALVPSGN